MALALCLTLLPAAALAEETEGTAQTPPAVEKSTDPANGEAKQEHQSAEVKQENQSAEQEEQQEDSASKQAVADVQAMIDALPDAAELDGMDDDNAMAVYEAFQTACDAYYETLTEEQRAQLKNTEKLAALSEWFNEQVAPLAEVTVFPDDVDANGNIIPYTNFSRTGPIFTGSQSDVTFTDAHFHIVQGNVTINGDLTVDGSKNGGLVLCDGATLTVNGALIHTGGSPFYIYGQTLTTGSRGTGKLVIKNSLDSNGAAIRAAANANDPRLNINSGELEIHAGNSDKLVDGVKLFSSKPIHKGTLDGNVVSPDEWKVLPMTGKTLVLAYCEHLDPTYKPSGTAQHRKNCKDCGFIGTAVNCAFDGTGGYAPGDENGHYALCICGNRGGTQIEHDKNGYVLTDNNTKHVSGCKACGYTSGKPENHTYKDGRCTVCDYACPHADFDLTMGEYNVVTKVTCHYCGLTGFVAVLDGKAYTAADTLEIAVTDWLEKGGTLTLYSHYANTIDFSTAHATKAGKDLILDLNGFAFNKDTKMDLGGAKLTIRDSREKVSSQGAFGPIIADSGTLTIMKDGYLNGLTVPEGSTAEFHLHSGKVNHVTCSKPVYTLLDDGYALMNGNITVGPTTILGESTATYTAKDTKTRLLSEKKPVSAVIGSNTIPFALSLETDDTQIGKMSFEWYVLKDGTTQKLAVSTSDVAPDTNGVYTFDPANVEIDPNGWTALKASEEYEVLCVVIGKEEKGAYCWQTPMRGYTLTVTKASLNSGNTEITVTGAGSLVYTGRPLTPEVKVTYNGTPLTVDTDYEVSYGSDVVNAGTHSLTVTGKGNYAGTKTVNFNIGRATLTVDGTGTASGIYGAKLSELTVSGLTAKMGGSEVTGTWSLTGDAVPNVGDTKTYTATFTPSTGADNYLPLTKDGIALSITEADVPTSTEQQTVTVTNNRAHTYAFDLAALLPKLESPKEYGNVTYELGTNTLDSRYYNADTASIENGRLILPIQAVETKEAGSIGSVEVKVSTTNYHDFTLTINVNATNKIVPTGTPTLSKNTLAWGEQLNTITLSGAMKDGDTEVKGSFAWTNSATTPSDMNDFEAEWKFTPENTDVYAEITDTVTIKVIKATPTGAPKYTAINASGKTLADAALTVNEKWPEGTVQWVDENGVELDVSAEVKANMAYRWRFVPTDTEHYNEASGAITLYTVSHSGGGGSSSGGSDSNPIIKTETKNHADGSTTKTETRRDGSVTQTTTGKDGSVSKTETKPDGSSVTENKAADGSTGTVKTDKNGQTEAAAKVSGKAVEDAKKNGEAVKAPVEVEASRNSSTAPTVKVELPKNSGETKVEIPVSNVKSGTVAVLVHPDGTEEILKDSIPTEDGIQLTVNGNATVKIVDNSKGFIDTRNHWAEDAIDFVSARGLVNGMSATIYAPNNSTTRAQLWTILARQNDADLSGGSVWYEKAQNWAKDKGVSDGANPNAAINRAQMVTMLWRAVGQPAPATAATFTDVPADAYYAGAVSWAVENGITTGIGNGRFDPTGACTRAQIATFLTRLYAEK